MAIFPLDGPEGFVIRRAYIFLKNFKRISAFYPVYSIMQNNTTWKKNKDMYFYNRN